MLCADIITGYTYIIISIVALPCLSNNIPSSFPKCYRNDPKLSDCMLRAFNQMRERARNGINEIGLPSLIKIATPLKIEQNTAFANYTATFPDYTVEGLDNFDIKMFQYDPETMTVRARVEFDSLVATGHANLGGTIVHVDIYGTGFGRCIMNPVNATFEVKGQMRRSKGIDYYHTKEVNVRLDISDTNCNVKGFFDNDEHLNFMANQIFNANTKLLAKTASALHEKIGEAGIRKFMDHFTKHIPYNDILPSLD